MSVNSTLKLYKLYTHMKHFCSEDLILNPKEHPNAKLGDVVEIYQHPEEENGCRLLLQITCFKEDLKGRDIISVEANVAAAFNLRTYDTMIMNIVDPASVALDSVEITFKDQYMGRSEMWRLKSFLTNTCVYTNKKIEHCSGLIRCQVYEMWAQGERVSCGVINEETKVVFRSSTSMVYLFIQMSSEMWDFDIHGDLYFEKAVNGFLTDLFLKWKKLGSNHEVTIVLFSRTFYAAKSLDEFPSYMRECLQMDYKGRYYEDFYRVAIQNERNDDWSSILVQLRRLFTSYQNTVLRYHDRSGSTVPATNSTAAQGNFLEVLNISLNVFEKHYLDRSFDRTGQLSVVITPGVGVFEVDRELTNITKQRIIDNGVGSDLVCVGEQPLHAVPLLKYHNKDTLLNTGDDYSMPHWINLSFYSTNKKVAYSTFIPRIKLPPLNPNHSCDENKENKKFKLSDDTQQPEYIHNSLFDYDAYDAQIFTIPSTHGCSLQRQSRTKKTSVPCLDGYGTCTSREWENMIRPQPVMRRKMSDPDIHHGNFHVLSNLSHNGSPNISESMSTLEKQGLKNVLNQSGTIVRPGRALINPFAPSHVTIKLTSNRRRWTHIFPKGPTGVLIQQHHYQAVPTSNGISKKRFADLDSSDFDHTSTCTIGGNIDVANSVLSDASVNKTFKRNARPVPNVHYSSLSPLIRQQIIDITNQCITSTTVSLNSTMNSKGRFSIKQNNVVSGVHSVSCCYDNHVEVELFFTKEKSAKTRMDYIYFNRFQDKDGKWTTYLNDLFQRHQNQCYLRVYGCNIRADNYESHHDSIIKHCLQKCHEIFVKVENESQPTPSGSELNAPMANEPNVICELMLSKFENHLMAMRFDYIKINSIICQKDDIRVELAMTENSSPSDIFARTYVNNVRESHHKWDVCLKRLWEEEFPNEWTPALTTGVDWKSLTIPACLPITTDYFPDKRSLHNDYVVSDYTLLPEGVYDEYAQNRAVYRKPLSTEDVFKELISQRLAQGFQLIVVPDKSATSPPQSCPACCGGLLHKHQAHNTVQKSSILNMPATNKPMKEYLLSIGRIFHKITLNDSEITVTRYRPRHPYPPINIDYRYRFQAPQHDTYEVSGVNFTTEKLENFNWNYMDQYICTRGDTDYPLQENLKYWRHRMYLLPKEHPAYKKILETGSSSTYCDIFVENSVETPKQIIDDFKNFLESYLNKIKKLHCPKMTKVMNAGMGSPTAQQQQSHLTGRRHSTSILSRPQGLLNSPFRERLGSNIQSDMRPRSGTKTMEKGPGRVSPAEAAALSLANVDSHASTTTVAATSDDKEDSFLNELKISPTASLTEILDAMKSPVNGINFLAKSQSLPSWTFVLMDAITWLQNRIDGKINPVEMLESMKKADMICHASGDKTRIVTPGFYLYYIVLQDKKSPDYVPPIFDLESFENEWMEVEISNPDNPYDTTVDTTEFSVPKFLRENVDINFFDGPIYKQAHLDIDVTQKSERTEWGHLRYHTKMTPGYAYEIVAQWLIASGPVVNHLINTWKRKANQSGFQLVSVPADPLAEPFTDKSDPLRGPIFIPLNIHCLEKDGNTLFKEFKKETWPDRLLLLQEAIVARFGFMPCYVETKTGSNQGTLDRQYIHCSGNMFILVASPHEGLKVRQRLASGSQMKRPTFIKRCPPSGDSPSTGMDTYVTRHVNVKNKEEFDVPRKIGFLWSWNHMIANKHWKMLTMSNTPDSELFQLRMLQDFKDFCSNQNDRLLSFWENCWIQKEKTFTKDLVC